MRVETYKMEVKYEELLVQLINQMQIHLIMQNK